jgi:Tol biopolymer transport system component
LLRSAINLPSGFHLDTQNSSLALSPDGRKLAIAAVGPDGKGQIWIRSMDSLTIQPVVGTEGASYPFWSPDSRYIGFFAGLKLKKIELSSGIVQTLCVAGEGRGASWSRTGMIVYAPQAFGGLYMLPASGGTPVQVTTVESQSISNRLPHFLPDGKRLLFFSGTDSTAKDNGIFLLDLDSRKITLVTKENSEGFYVEPGYLVFVRNRDLMAQPFDLKRLQTTGQAIPIAEQVVCNPGRWTGEYSLAESGLLVFQSGSGVYRSQLTWFDTDGKKLGTVGEPAGFLSISISPDQKRALTLILGNDSHQDLWMYDLVRGVASRFSFGNSDIGESVWSPDGRRVFYDVAIGSLYWKASDGSLEPHELATGVPVNYVAAVSPDGKMLAFMTQTTQGGDIWLLPLEGNQKARPFIVTAASETKGSFSPDGRWFAYISDETGRDELFVVSFPGPGGKRQISSDGADFPQWLEGGRKLVYINAGRKLISVDINSKGQELEIGQSHSLFGGHPLPAVPQDSSSWGTPVYITSDGKRILLPVPLEESPPPPLTLVTNWTAELKK